MHDGRASQLEVPLDMTDTALRERLAFLVSQTSQADVARRTGVSRNNINRYLKGVKIPGSVCAALVRGLGVNAGWLLSGDGTPLLADGAEPMVSTAGELLGLVRAMNAVMSMRLGALAGKERQKVLRELSESLARYEELRAKVVDLTRPLFERLVSDMETAIFKRDLDAARQLERAAVQMSSICEDDRLRRLLAEYRAIIEDYQGNHAQAQERLWELVRRHLASSWEVDGYLVTQVATLSALLTREDRFKEARRISRPILALIDIDASKRQVGGPVILMDGWCDVMLEDIEQGLPKMREGYALCTSGNREAMRGPYVTAQLLAGSISFDEVLTYDERYVKSWRATSQDAQARRVFEFALWLDEPAALERACQIYGTKGAASSVDVGVSWVHLCARLVREAQIGKPGTAKARKLAAAFNDGAARPTSYVMEGEIGALRKTVMRCLLMRTCGGTQQALKLLEEADGRLAQLGTERMPGFLLRAQHYRNMYALAAGSGASHSAWRKTARAFFEHAAARGYLCCKDLLLEK